MTKSINKFQLFVDEPSFEKAARREAEAAIAALRQDA